MADWQTVDQVINDVDSQLMAWYSTVTQKPMVVAGPSTDVVRAQVLATAAQQAPTTALLVSNPMFLIGIAAVLVLVLVLIRE